jgi:uncharacterized protein (DUF302 family)
MPTPSPTTPGVITRISPWPVAETVERLTAAIRARGIKLFAVIDHSGEAAVAGLEMRDTKLLVFGSPQAGTPVMAARPLAALDLPLKLLVWDDDGRTSVSYVPPNALAARYGLTGELAARLGGVEAVTSAVLGSPAAGRSGRTSPS